MGDADGGQARATDAVLGAAMLVSDSGFDLVFSDLVMPGAMDGLDLVREVRRRWPTTPVLLTTGFSGALAAVHEAGAPVLQKPYGLNALSAAVNDAVRSGVVPG